MTAQLVALLPQYEKEAMGVVVGIGGALAAVLLVLARRLLVAVASLAVGVAIAVASFTVNVEDDTYWGTFRDQAVFAAWSLVVVLAAVLGVRRFVAQRRERFGGPNSRSAQAGQ